MKAQDLQQMNIEELEEQLKEKRTELAKLRFDASSRQLKNHHLLKQARNDIARIMTVMGQIQVGQKTEQDHSKSNKQ